MKLKKVLPILVAAVAFECISCGSAPKQEPVEEPKVVEPISEPEPVPEPQPVVQEITPEPDFSEANAALLKGTDEAKAGAEAVNAEKYCSEKFASLNSEYDQLKKDMESNPKADYSDRIKNLTSKYKALEKAAVARALKEKIDELGLSAYDKKSYDDGESALAEFDAFGENADGKAMLEKATSAFNSYTAVFSKAFKSLAGAERKAALEAKKLADSVKAGVSQKESYKNASEKFKKADSSFVTANIEGAYKEYKESKEIFQALYEKVFVARKAAAEAIERAKARALQSEEYAVDADSISPLGDGEVKGIEAEETKLLEDDNFEDSKNAEIDVESDSTAKAAEVAAEALVGAVEALENINKAESENSPSETTVENAAEAEPVVESATEVEVSNESELKDSTDTDNENKSKTEETK